MKDGKRKGIGLYLMNDGERITINCKDDDYESISSSIDYKNTAASMKAAKNQSFSLVMSNFTAAAMTSVEVSKGIKDIKANNPSASTVESPTNTDTTSESKSSTTTSSSNKSKIADCGSNWRSDSRVYSNYESQLIKMRTYPEKPANYTSDYTDIQTKMRQIRLKWEAQGCLITKSQYE
ncbi:MAG: hypothetical protein LUD15_09925 [Bacteroides sp.]|nr:hypothetical protein [Bacteroides sp.]